MAASQRNNASNLSINEELSFDDSRSIKRSGNNLHAPHI